MSCISLTNPNPFMFYDAFQWSTHSPLKSPKTARGTRMTSHLQTPSHHHRKTSKFCGFLNIVSLLLKTLVVY